MMVKDEMRKLDSLSHSRSFSLMAFIAQHKNGNNGMIALNNTKLNGAIFAAALAHSNLLLLVLLLCYNFDLRTLRVKIIFGILTGCCISR
jgi:hypothetical protein